MCTKKKLLKKYNFIKHLNCVFLFVQVIDGRGSIRFNHNLCAREKKRLKSRLIAVK